MSIAANSPAADKLIRELQLRTQTGASFIGIERNGASLINPGPDEELHAGDQIMLMGSRAQLDAALALLGGHTARNLLKDSGRTPPNSACAKVDAW